jgi:hypothetical protein
VGIAEKYDKYCPDFAVEGLHSWLVSGQNKQKKEDEINSKPSSL